MGKIPDGEGQKNFFCSFFLFWLKRAISCKQSAQVLFLFLKFEILIFRTHSFASHRSFIVAVSSGPILFDRFGAFVSI